MGKAVIYAIGVGTVAMAFRISDGMYLFHWMVFIRV